MKFVLAALIMGISTAAECPKIEMTFYNGGTKCTDADKKSGGTESYTPKAACTATGDDRKNNRAVWVAGGGDNTEDNMPTHVKHDCTKTEHVAMYYSDDKCETQK